MAIVRAHDGEDVYYEVHGDGPVVLLGSADPRPPDHPLREEVLRSCRTLIDGLADRYRVVVMSYPGRPKPQTLTPDNVTEDLLTIADAVDAEEFAWWGYSWGGVAGLQLAVRTDRLTALAMTGFPPLGGPYAAMLRYAGLLAEVDVDAMGAPIPPAAREQLPQFVTYYEALQGFDDRAAQPILTCPRMCFVGGADEITAGSEPIAHLGTTVAERREELIDFGWEVEVIAGLDHFGAAEPEVVLPRLGAFLDRHLLGATSPR
ncbi:MULTISPECIES: alpha/beta fold hydrolase [Actinoalloteichus]|uniref:Hydrolase or acyltransferase of alpha/beta superfamily n=1 Tax=Actinoalloteichus fjordicus TaxID=1612552 RepID=A0AAC9LD39_9PSEU|nr:MULTISPECIES: alpha/beta hydrolase [Actinoalloteichus]APU15643.1 putative hydrolase or acyltransferase of alpha/beta superfamily [Actinoalloteichus fjordicus]APU21703.1 putative hydrolase or acyltransferase of alpha/beta superfamily [Actinoalloteichus sp. GBA129-24]